MYNEQATCGKQANVPNFLTYQRNIVTILLPQNGAIWIKEKKPSPRNPHRMLPCRCSKVCFTNGRKEVMLDNDIIEHHTKTTHSYLQGVSLLRQA